MGVGVGVAVPAWGFSKFGGKDIAFDEEVETLSLGSHCPHPITPQQKSTSASHPRASISFGRGLPFSWREQSYTPSDLTGLL